MAFEHQRTNIDTLKERVKAEATFGEQSATPNSVVITFDGRGFPYKRDAKDWRRPIPDFNATPEQLQSIGITQSHLDAFEEIALQIMDACDEENDIGPAS